LLCLFHFILFYFIFNSKQAFREYPILKDMVDMVEAGYEKGVPKHRLPAARSREFDPDASSIFVTSWDDFAEIPSKEIQEIFRHRHILVSPTPTQTLNFDEEGLSTLAPLNQRCVVQGN
jgi:hypothetical protein